MKISTLSPDVQDFTDCFESGQTQLVWITIPGDLETPVSAALKLCEAEPYSFLLESVEGGNVLGRYSIIGFKPDLIWRCKNAEVEIGNAEGVWTAAANAPLESLRAHIQACRIDNIPPELPPMAVSGLFGYVGYDMVRLVEDIPAANPDTLGIPDSVLMRPSLLAIFDNVKQLLTLVAPVYAHSGNTQKKASVVFKEASALIAVAMEKLSRPVPLDKNAAGSAIQTPLTVHSCTTRAAYHATVKKAVEYIYEGEIFQVVPSQRFAVDFDLPAFDLYRSLRRLNPSPFLFYLAFDGFHLVGASPEILVRVRDGEVTVRPIAGTRKRGETPEEDNALAQELLADEKERAEHLMLLDLGRNDVGRVAEFGSVKVTDSFVIERYSHVMHIVSNVVGRLKSTLDIVDAFFAGFPAGTVSGAPKVRAMEIIDELESNRRGVYAGGVGYFSGNGALDTCIALRTALVKDGKVYVQAGGGVVADSDPEFEYQETLNKSKALIRAAELALEYSRVRRQA
ncbi:MAG: anthranilate synthase component I [Alphaproteobacteria bacterium]|nr:anthranilate synthase component I [Alphaproteobacteria bacterium]